MSKRPTKSNKGSKSKKPKIEESQEEVGNGESSQCELLTDEPKQTEKSTRSKKARSDDQVELKRPKIDQSNKITVTRSKKKSVEPEKSKKSKRIESENEDKQVKSESDEPSTSAGVNGKAKKSSQMAESKMKPTKVKKVNTTRNADIEDPSSTTKSSVHKYPFVYNGTTYYCKYLPDHFQEHWEGICKMRGKSDAPVDSMGASKLANRSADPATQRFQTLISIMLSSQTKDEKVSEAMSNLKKHGLTVESMLKIDPDRLLELIRVVGFNTSKTKYIKETAQILHDQYDGDVPRTKAEIQSLPGCGPKVTNLAMWCCWNEITGLAVDTHMERIFGKRLKWSSFEKSDKQMKEIESWMPKAMWAEVNEKIVGFGQTICNAKNPQCGQCLIKHTCDYYKNQF